MKEVRTGVFNRADIHSQLIAVGRAVSRAAEAMPSDYRLGFSDCLLAVAASFGLELGPEVAPPSRDRMSDVTYRPSRGGE